MSPSIRVTNMLKAIHVLRRDKGGACLVNAVFPGVEITDQDCRSAS
jgi:hypothetical protein